ncbi:Protein of unknown function [Pyronema omphalodes CBS 100304]|uniref:Uncharacterized protein n=1 Tax=Pyronema omphalodes (strain CBS 100304) TaxID=1076935 RepID=U4KX60_PYROM|nr:Protein of unknown function [Pyronema omphalodes CBS 100304]
MFSKFHGVDRSTMAELIERIKWPLRMIVIEGLGKQQAAMEQILAVLEESNSARSELQKQSDQIWGVLAVLGGTIEKDKEIHTMLHTVQNIEKELKDEDVEKILIWLSSIDPQKRNQDNRAKRVKETDN